MIIRCDQGLQYYLVKLAIFGVEAEAQTLKIGTALLEIE